MLDVNKRSFAGGKITRKGGDLSEVIKEIDNLQNESYGLSMIIKLVHLESISNRNYSKF
jgi:hypothetical protein